ncbi:3-hydroxyisobutyrate dehydrogenase [Rhizobium oryziradicis]|uniref:3-hydroxyisobutyrate dehydrogenase n=1 Tax=Rhizobium oryziradicis TaxID=1867956 RepID=A0A1Q8ZXW4_9HYPH|nr:3-hydroxyisobutyrate dehydrogenase [Rhizobium oryziradicis]OLP46907.1 3-hydroxyisobutyrate dehydrogenase [Rhizobium oryziradicis]
MAKIAFIGLGNMGLPMAANLAKVGHQVSGCDVSEAALEAANKLGIEPAKTIEEAVASAEVVITMLPAGRHVITVWGTITAHASAGALLIDCSTIDVDSARKAHTMAEAASFLSLDAPVSGGTGGANAGTLTFMAGGTVEAFSKAKPLLEVMGAKIVHCGEAGAGQAAKICNNMILGISMLGVCEAFALGERLGLSHEALFAVASTSSGQCWSLTSYCPVPGPVPNSPANRDYAPGFAAQLMLKDLKLAQDAALATGASTPMGAQAQQLYSLFEKQGHGGRDFSAIIELLRDHQA